MMILVVFSACSGFVICSMIVSGRKGIMRHITVSGLVFLLVFPAVAFLLEQYLLCAISAAAAALALMIYLIINNYNKGMKNYICIVKLFK